MLSLVAIGDEVSGEEVGLQTVYLEAASNYSLIQMLAYTMAKMGCTLDLLVLKKLMFPSYHP